MSDSCPENVCLHIPSRMSHNYNTLPASKNLAIFYFNFNHTHICIFNHKVCNIFIILSLAEICHFVYSNAKTSLVSLHWIDRQLPRQQCMTFAEASHAPDTKVLESGDKLRLITSPVWPSNDVVCCPVSMSHSALQFTPATVTQICHTC